MDTVELRPAMEFTCDACGRDNHITVPVRTLDPANPDDRPLLLERVEADIERLWDAVGSGEPVFDDQSRHLLDDILLAAVWSSIDRYSVRVYPLSVKCRHCDHESATIAGERVLEDLDDAADDLDEDGEDGEW